MADEHIWPLTVLVPVAGLVSLVCCVNWCRWRKHNAEHVALLSRIEYVESKVNQPNNNPVPIYVPQTSYYPQPASYPYPRPSYQSPPPIPTAPPAIGPRMV